MQDRSPPEASVHDTTTSATDLLNLHELVAKARQNLNQNDWDYIVGAVESETTLRRNRMALDAIAFRRAPPFSSIPPCHGADPQTPPNRRPGQGPRRPRGVSQVDGSVTEFDDRAIDL